MSQKDVKHCECSLLNVITSKLCGVVHLSAPLPVVNSITIFFLFTAVQAAMPQLYNCASIIPVDICFNYYWFYKFLPVL